MYAKFCVICKTIHTAACYAKPPYALAQAGHVTGASLRNWAGYGDEVALFDDIADWQRAILTDPQTSGGLLVSCSAEAAEQVMAVFRAQGFDRAALIGRLAAGSGRVVVTA